MSAWFGFRHWKCLQEARKSVLQERLYSNTVKPSTKEPRFFDMHFHRGIEWYRAHYPRPVEGRPMGEVAPTYFASSAARERIGATIPEARVVCIFRNPVERVVSLYRLKRAYGMIPWSFEQAIVRDPELIGIEQIRDESQGVAPGARRWPGAGHGLR
jgi:Sulfotransferase domain